MAIREGRWDCSCGRVGNRGPQRSCTGCNRPRGENVEFYLPEDAPEVTDEASLEKAEAGPDRRCEHCESDSPAGSKNCIGCGADLEGDPERPVIDYGLDDVPRTGAAVSRSASGRRQPVMEYRPEGIYAGRTSISLLGKVLIGAGIAGAIVLLVLFLRTHEEPVSAAAFSWERTIAIEAYRTLAEEDWAVPSGGRETGSFRAIHHYDSVLDHYKDVPTRVQTGTKRVKCGTRSKGNGYFEDVYCNEPVYGTKMVKEAVYRQDPVYRTKYRYDIERWVPARTDRARGNDQNPRWPESVLASNERQGGRGETYMVFLQDQRGESHELSCSYAEWMTFKRGRQYAASFNSFDQFMGLRR